MDFSTAAQSLGLLNGALRLHQGKVYDIFQNFFEFYYVAGQDGHYRVRYQLTNSEHTQRLCEQLIKIGQSYSQNLQHIGIYNMKEDYKILKPYMVILFVRQAENAYPTSA